MRGTTRECKTSILNDPSYMCYSMTEKYLIHQLCIIWIVLFNLLTKKIFFCLCIKQLISVSQYNLLELYEWSIRSCCNTHVFYIYQPSPIIPPLPNSLITFCCKLTYFVTSMVYWKNTKIFFFSYLEVTWSLFFLFFSREGQREWSGGQGLWSHKQAIWSLPFSSSPPPHPP